MSPWLPTVHFLSFLFSEHYFLEFIHPAAIQPKTVIMVRGKHGTVFLLHHPLFKLLWHLSATVLFSSKAAASAAPALLHAKSGCQASCGNLTIPYPFGVGEGCYLGNKFDVTCNTSLDPPKAFIINGKFEVVNITSVQVRVKNSVAYYCHNESGQLTPRSGLPTSINLTDSPYTLSDHANKFVSMGCNSLALMEGIKGTMSGCASVCSSLDTVINGSCSGIGCCQTSIPKGLKFWKAKIKALLNDSDAWKFNPCGFAFLVDEDGYTFQASYLAGSESSLESLASIPVVLDWTIGNETCQLSRKNLSTYACKENSFCQNSENGPGYRCSCSKGYHGNPYLSPGCQDINECENPDNPCQEGTCINTPGSFNCTCPEGTYGDGRKDGKGCIKNNRKFPFIPVFVGIGLAFLFLLLGIPWLYFFQKKRSITRLREKFFKQNGGLYLQQQMAFSEGCVDSTKIFTAQELEKATDNYSEKRIIGRGGNGIVYKGLLPVKTIAIKRSQKVDQSQLKQFINEVLVLTQINHRNVVKLLGCCLETEVPSLVYEYVCNGNLYQHIHNKKGYSLTWNDRLRIATETATALAYLHSATSTPIIHRDVKSANILLDDKFTAKVADFGASRLIPADEYQVTTLVQGTLGYLDPEYFHSSQLTEKSDVYSFGVVLVELLTGELAFSFDRPEEVTNLSFYFLSSIQQNRLLHILDPQVKNGEVKQVMAVAELAQRCLKLKGEERPTMKEVAVELEALTKFDIHPWEKGGYAENVGLLHEPSGMFSTRSSFNNFVGGSLPQLRELSDSKVASLMVTL